MESERFPARRIPVRQKKARQKARRETLSDLIGAGNAPGEDQSHGVPIDDLVKCLDAGMERVCDCKMARFQMAVRAKKSGNDHMCFIVIIVRNTFLSTRSVIEPEPGRMTEALCKSEISCAFGITQNGRAA